MPVNPWDFRFEGDPDDEPDDLGADLEAAFLELEKLRYLFPSTDEFIYVADEDPVLNEYVVRKGTRRPDKYTCLRYWQFLVLDGPTAKTAYHMRACEFCRTTMREAVEASASANLKALYDRLWTMPLDPTDEEVEQMEALADLKNALRELEDEAAAERVTARKRLQNEDIAASLASVDEVRLSMTEPAPSQSLRSTTVASIGRRRFLATLGAFGLLAVGVSAGAAWKVVASRSTTAPLGSADAVSDFRVFDLTLTKSGPIGIQSTFASGTDTDAIRIVRWIGIRKNPTMMPLLVSIMSDPRVKIRSLAVNTAILLPPAILKPHLPLIQLTAAAELNPAIQSLYTVLIPAIQNA